MEKYKLIRPADVYVTNAQYLKIISDRANGIPHPEITNIRLTGNSFIDHFASLIEEGAGVEALRIAAKMGLTPALLTPAVEAITGLSAHQWACEYVLLSACDKLSASTSELSSLARRLGFSSLSAFSHFFFRHTHISPKNFRFNRNAETIIPSVLPPIETPEP